MIGAAMPIAAYVGTRPMAAVARPTPSKTVTMIFLRPSRSASAPNSAAPPGRIKMLTANEANTRARLSVSLSAGKICFPTGPATYSSMNRSNRSKAQPITDAKAADTGERASGVAVWDIGSPFL